MRPTVCGRRIRLMPLFMKKDIFASLALALAPLTLSVANVTLPAVISDGMVLEQNSTVKLWGWAKPYEIVTIKTSWDTATYRATPTPLAQWSVEIPTPAGSTKKHTIEFQGYNCLSVKDVLVGEVVLCAGQSNMEFQPSWGQWDGYAHRDSLLAQATQDDIRMFRVDYRTAAQPTLDVSGHWVPTTPDNARNFSVIGYVMACRLRAELGVPVGIVDASWGGTPIETWMPAEAFDADPRLRALNGRLSEVSWGPVRPALAYNAMLEPLMDYKFRAVAWYQGEQNCENADGYSLLLQELVRRWRARLYAGADVPFVYAQIAPHKYQDPGMAVVVRDQQRQALAAIDNSALVVIGDLGDVADIHPRFKVEAGNRFANAVLTKAYGRAGFGYAAPLLAGARLAKGGRHVVVSFANAEGLHITGKSKTANWFELAGDDGVFHRAEGRIQKDGTVVVSSREVKRPAAVRYAWADDAWPNLSNGAGVQASCFGAVAL